ncbi:MAG: sulfite exporter TauE/SafE family protein [Aestuariivirgaceae bacterium]
MLNPANDPIFTICAVAAAIFIGLSKGGVPVIGMLGVPVLALVISPLRAAALLLPIYVVTDMFGLWAYRRQFSRRNLNILVPAAILGIAVGWMTAAIVPEALVGMIVGLIGLGYCLDLWLKRKRTAAPRKANIPPGLFWGTLTGFTSFVSHSGAPPYQMYVMPQRLPKLVFAGTSAILFAIVNAVKLIPYWALGQLSADNLMTAAWLFPIGIIATLAGVRLVKAVSEGLFYRLVTIALFLVSAKLAVDGATALLG